jgi:hypothetical protein
MSCLCFPLEILMGIAGIVALAAGRIGLGRLGMTVLEGRPARLVGVVLVTPLAVGILAAIADVLLLLAAPDQYGGIAIGLMFVRGLIVVVCIITFLIVGLAYGRPARPRNRPSTRMDDSSADPQPPT